jgi:hypothetical protein
VPRLDLVEKMTNIKHRGHTAATQTAILKPGLHNGDTIKSVNAATQQAILNGGLHNGVTIKSVTKKIRVTFQQSASTLNPRQLFFLAIDHAKKQTMTATIMLKINEISARWTGSGQWRDMLRERLSSAFFRSIVRGAEQHEKVAV